MLRHFVAKCRKAPQWDTASHSLPWLQLKRLAASNAGKNMEWPDCFTLLVESVTATLEKSWALSLTRWLAALGGITSLLVPRHLPISTQAKPTVGEEEAKTAVLIYYKLCMNPGCFLSSFMSWCICCNKCWQFGKPSHVFELLLKPDKTGKLRGL